MNPDPEIIYAVNVALISFSGVEAIFMLLSFREGIMQVRLSRALFAEVVVTFFTMFFHAASLIYDSTDHYMFSTGMLALSYIGIYFIYYLYVVYIREQINLIEGEDSVPRAVTYLSLVLFIIGALFWVLSIFDSIGVELYDAASAFTVGDAGGYILIAFSLVILINHHVSLGGRQTLILSIMPVMMLAVTYIEPFTNGIELRYPAIMLGIIIVYSQHYLDVENRAQKAENDEIRLRLNMATDRMKPHYLYNVLTTIYYLCDTDPSKAQNAIGTFSEYLRNTLETMEKKELVDFSWELDEIGRYLTLEQLRFEDRLNVEYDIEYTDFKVPPLSIEPLVENAVKHGISPKEEGGTVTIVTREIAGGGVQIRISDDGVGFAVDSLGRLDKTHEGIANVRERIRLEVGGDLSISSEPGKGTTAVITIWPDNAKKKRFGKN